MSGKQECLLGDERERKEKNIYIFFLLLRDKAQGDSTIVLEVPYKGQPPADRSTHPLLHSKEQAQNRELHALLFANILWVL